MEFKQFLGRIPQLTPGQLMENRESVSLRITCMIYQEKFQGDLLATQATRFGNLSVG